MIFKELIIILLDSRIIKLLMIFLKKVFKCIQKWLFLTSVPFSNKKYFNFISSFSIVFSFFYAYFLKNFQNLLLVYPLFSFYFFFNQLILISKGFFLNTLANHLKSQSCSSEAPCSRPST